MRLWSLHPQYLDSQGLVALWREGLLAKHVLEGKTKGYKNHPQLDRFKRESEPVAQIKKYLHIICDEAEARGYNFDRSKLGRRPTKESKIKVTQGQVEYEWQHLLKKLFKRSRKQYFQVKKNKSPVTHSLFKVVRGPVEDWEVI